MRAFLFIVVVLADAVALGQGFNRRYDFANWGFAQTALGIELLPDGYLTIGGGTDHDSIGPGLFFSHGSVHLTRIGLNGELIWEKRAFRPYHTSLPGWSNCCDTIPGGGYVVGGVSEDSTGFDEVYLMRFDADGDTLWTRVFGDPNGNDFWIGSQAKHLDEGGFLVVGYTGPNTSTWSGFAIRTDLLGNEQWRMTYSWFGSPYTSLTSCAAAAHDDLFMGGARYLTVANGDFWIQRTNAVGGLRWRVSWGGQFSDGITQVTAGADGHVLACGIRSYAPGYTSSQPYLAKLDSSDGSILWEREYGPQLYSHLFNSLQECLDGNVIAAGRCFEQPGPTVQKGLLALTSAEGDSLWKLYYFYVDSIMSTGQGTFHDVMQTQDGGFIAVGSVNNPVGQGNPPGYSQDTWVVKVDSMGCIVPGCNSVGITEQATNLLAALRIWPNPVQSGQSVTVQLELPPSLHGLPLAATLVSADGKAVWQQALGTVVGQTTFNLQPPQLSAGMYYVHVASEGKWLTGGKLIVQ